MKISAYIPCYNNRGTIAGALASIRAQSCTVDELFVVDDGSTDGTPEVVESLGIRVVRLGKNLGRGAARATAMQEAGGDLVICCDATCMLESDFLKNALPWFADEKVAGVFGSSIQPEALNALDRWRERHLFKTAAFTVPEHGALLATGGAVLRASAVKAAGNFNPDLHHSEDADLGRRLLAAGNDVIHDPALKVASTLHNTLGKVLERYWRWNSGAQENISWNAYLKQISYSIKVMAREDLRSGDPKAAVISLLTPHYQFWRSWLNRRTKKPDEVDKRLPEP